MSEGREGRRREGKGKIGGGNGREGTGRKGRVTTCCPISNELSPPMGRIARGTFAVGRRNCICSNAVKCAPVIKQRHIYTGSANNNTDNDYILFVFSA